jgi:hypothetical protein
LSLDDEGFLSPDISKFRDGIRAKHRAYFDLVERLNKFCQQTKYRLSVHNRDGQELFAGCLVIKLLNDVQAAILLLERGLVSQGRSMLRVALECLIVLAKICQSYDFVHAYIKVGEHDRLKFIRAIKQNPGRGFDFVRSDITEELIATIAQTIGATENRRKVEQWAKDTGLSHLYDGTYRLFSQDVHSSPRAIDQYFMADERDDVIGFEWGPEAEKDLQAELLEAARVLVVGMSIVGELFQLNIKQDLDGFSVDLGRLDKLTKDELES